MGYLREIPKIQQKIVEWSWALITMNPAYLKGFPIGNWNDPQYFEDKENYNFNYFIVDHNPSHPRLNSNVNYRHYIINYSWLLSLYFAVDKLV